MGKKYYLYNVAQSNFYMLEGCRCLGTGIHRKTNKPFWIFGEEDTKEAYEKWRNFDTSRC